MLFQSTSDDCVLIMFVLKQQQTHTHTKLSTIEAKRFLKSSRSREQSGHCKNQVLSYDPGKFLAFYLLRNVPKGNTYHPVNSKSSVDLTRWMSTGSQDLYYPGAPWFLPVCCFNGPACFGSGNWGTFTDEDQWETGEHGSRTKGKRSTIVKKH